MDVMGLYAVDRATIYALSHKVEIDSYKYLIISSQTFREVITSIPG